jgi:hypothetical protein
VPKPLAEIAIDAGLISRSELVRVAQLADEQGLPLVVALVRSAGVDEVSLVAALRRQARVPSADPAAVEVDPEALRELDRDVCRRLRVLPVSMQVAGNGARSFTVAMADPTDAVAIAEVEHHLGCRIEVILLPLSAVEEMVEQGYRAFVTEVMRRSPGTFGGDLQVSTRPIAEDPGQRRGLARKPTTTPFRRLSDDAELVLQHRALLELLVEKGLLTRDEYEARVRQLMKRRDGES